jgi:hypothetical protein
MNNKKIRISKGEQGAQLLSYFLIFIFGILIYLGIISWRPILGYYYIKDSAVDAVKPGYFKNKTDYVPTESEVRGAIIGTAQAWSIPLQDKNIKIQRSKENITATVNYTWTFNLFGYEYIKRFNFTEVGENVK